jgi:hypothetical protein
MGQRLIAAVLFGIVAARSVGSGAAGPSRAVKQLLLLTHAALCKHASLVSAFNPRASTACRNVRNCPC